MCHVLFSVWCWREILFKLNKQINYSMLPTINIIKNTKIAIIPA